jgi:hypothetical protein
LDHRFMDPIISSTYLYSTDRRLSFKPHNLGPDSFGA